MNKLQCVVDELRFLLQREAFERTDELAGLLSEYSTFCHEVNSRLRRCDECLKQGLRSEAIHLCEASPNLLDAVAVLDFPEREQFLDILSMYFLTPPEPLLLDVASALNEAYAQHEPLQKLLDSHRLLALGRCPLSQRLSVLRSLASLDEGSPHWEADVREMERARLRELDAESRNAMKIGDLNALKSHLAEVQSDAWLEQVPPPLLRDVKSRATQSNRTRALERMRELNDQLHDAFAALDLPAARPLRDEWERMQQIARIDLNGEEFAHIAPILKWLEENDRADEAEKAYSKSILAIERALDKENITATELKRLGMEADRHDRNIPESLEARYRARLSNLELSERRRRHLLIGAGAAGFFAAIGLFGTIIYSSLQAENARRIASAVETLVEENKLEDARKLLEREGSHSSSEAWLTAQKKLIEAEQAEHDRIVQLKAEIETATRSNDSKEAESALRKARDLARTSDEKVEVGKLQTIWQKRLADEIAKRESVFREGIANASKCLKELDEALRDSNASDPKMLRELVGGAVTAVEALSPMKESVAGELKTQSTLLESRLGALRKAVAESGRKAELLEKLTAAAFIVPAEAISKAGNYESALRDLAVSFPMDPRAAIFQATADASPLPAFVARLKLLGRWKRMRPVDQKDVEARLREVKSFLTEHAQSPDAPVMRRYEEWLTYVCRRFADNGDPDEGAVRRITALFNARFIKDGAILRDQKGNTFYVKSPKDMKVGDLVTFDCQIGFNNEVRKETLRSTELVGTTPDPAPQQQVAAKIRDAVRVITVEGWHKGFREYADTIMNAKQMDPFLKYLLLLKTLEFAGRGDLFLEDELGPVLGKLDDDEIDKSVAWMDPRNESAKKARDRAIKLLDEIPPLDDVFARADARQELLEEELFAPRFAIGWLDRTPRGEWICRSNWTPIGNHVLFAVSPSESNGEREWISVGHVQDKTLVVNSALAPKIGEMSLIFASPSTSKSKTAQLP